MKSKILFISILLLSFIFSVSAYAESNIQEIVVSKIDIPGSYVVFNSAIADGNTSKFWWRTPVDAENGGEISVTADENGNILTYYHFKNDYISKDEGAHFSVYNKSDARFFALRFIEKICPELVNNVEYNKTSLESDISKNMKTASVSYYRIENGVPYYDNYMNFIIDLNTAEVVQYNLIWDFEAEFPDISEVISQPAAIRQYNSKINYGLQYRVRNKDGKNTAYLVYCPEEENIFIEADTGKVLRKNTFIDKSYDNNEGTFDETVISAAEVENAVLDMISAEEYVRNINDLGLDNNYTLTYSAYEKVNGNDCIYLEFSRIPETAFDDMTEEEKLMYISGDYSYVRVKIDVKNKDILWLSCYNKELTEKTITDDSARWSIEKFLKTYLPLKFDNCRFSEINSGRNNEIYKAAYVCYVGDIPYMGNNITVEYDCRYDSIISLDCKWLNDVEFSRAIVSIDTDNAKNILFSKVPFELTYISTSDGIKAVYMFYPYYPSAVGADDGILKNDDGSNYKIRKYDNYMDIEGHYAQGMIMRLNNNLIISSDDENYFKPDANVSQKDYLTWMVTALTGKAYENADDLYSYLTVNNIISSEEAYPEAEILKEDAIVFFIRAIGYESIAQVTDIYKLDFSDSSIITPYKYGYIALAKGIGMINGDENNKIKPKTPLTRADACCIIYKYLAR